MYHQPYSYTFRVWERLIYDCCLGLQVGAKLLRKRLEEEEREQAVKKK
jgi:hypothetical protein